MSSADIPVPASILKKKSSIARIVDTTRHTMEKNYNDDGSSTNSIVKRKIPLTKALVAVQVHPEKRFAYTGKVYEHDDNFADESERHYSGKKKVPLQK
ncbi:MAG TPA: hypothetical protein VKL21_03915 [Candidatus Methanoperedens sp.]|nr:hypothetical protein [Candidatus Methanoperedens sp.]